jgi:diadenosine tetraphosphate (Ap4A) HIT family hydrolase
MNSNSSTVTGYCESCVFCRENAARRDTNFARIYPEFEHRRIIEHEKYVIFPCIGQLAEAHSLIVPKRHVNTFGMVPRADLIELMDAINEFRSKYASSKEVLIFEHGARDANHGGCGIYHAHLHLVPLDHCPDPNDLFAFERGTTERNLENALIKAGQFDQYVLVGSLEKGFEIQELLKPLPSQFLRRNLALLLGVSGWDWRGYHREQSLIDLLERSTRPVQN